MSTAEENKALAYHGQLKAETHLCNVLPSGWGYVVEGGESYKIGMTVNLKRRIRRAISGNDVCAALGSRLRDQAVLGSSV